MVRSKITEEQVRDDDFLSEAEALTLSGSLRTQIDAKPDTLLELTDTPGVYNVGKYLKSTVFGTEWSEVTISGSLVYFDAYDNAGGTTVGDYWVDVPLTVERQKTDEFAHGIGSSELIVNATGIYIILARATVSISTGTSRTDSSMRLVIDTGGGYVEVPGTSAIMYHRTLNYGENTGNFSAILSLNYNDRIKIQVKRDNGYSTLQLLADGSSLSVFSTIGATGPAGEDGSPGAGSTIILKDQGTTVSGSPFSIINFTGAGVRHVKEQSSGQAEVYIEPLFGAWYGWSLDDTESSSNSTAWTNKITYTSPTLPNGHYRIGYSFEWKRGNTNNDFKARIQINNTTTIMEMNEESKDINSWHPASGFNIMSLSAGNYTIDLDFSGEHTSYTSYIRRARLEFWMITDY